MPHSQMTAPSAQNPVDLVGELRAKLASMLGCTADKVDPNLSFFKLGLDSFTFVEFIADLENRFNFKFSEEELLSKDLRNITSIARAVSLKTGADK